MQKRAALHRLEVLYHSIHYIDLVRSWFGNPRAVYGKTVRNPGTPSLAATKSVIVMDYGDWKRALIATWMKNGVVRSRSGIASPMEPWSSASG